jgi:hypothetical protein
LIIDLDRLEALGQRFGSSISQGAWVQLLHFFSRADITGHDAKASSLLSVHTSGANTLVTIPIYACFFAPIITPLCKRRQR